MVIMSTALYESLERSAHANSTALLIQEGMAAIERGECSNAFEVVEKMRGRYGL